VIRYLITSALFLEVSELLLVVTALLNITCQSVSMIP